MADDSKTDSVSNRLISRRRFLETGIATGLIGMSGHDQMPRVDLGPCPELPVPKAASNELRVKFEKANIKLNAAIESAADDLKNLTERYGITNIGELRRGITISILPAHGGQDTVFTVATNAKQHERTQLKGFANVIDTAVELEKLYDALYHQQIDKPPESINYDIIINKVLYSYRKHNPDKPDLKGMEPLVQGMLKDSMASVLSYTERERSRAELQAANGHFTHMMEKYKNHSFIFSDPTEASLIHARPVIIIDADERRRQGGAIMVDNRVREKYGTYLPIPEPSLLKHLRGQELTPLQSSMIREIDQIHHRKTTKSMNHPVSLTMSGPLGIGEMNLNVNVEVLNPSLRANRIQHRAEIRQR